MNCVNCADIGEYAFKDCTSLQVIWTGGLSNVRRGTFQNCEKLQATNLAWIDTLTAVSDYAFNNCTSLSTFNSATKTIGNHAYDGCVLMQDNLTSFCTEIGRYAFKNCTNLSSLVAPNCTFIDYNAFEGTKLWDVEPSA